MVKNMVNALEDAAIELYVLNITMLMVLNTGHLDGKITTLVTVNICGV